MHLSVENVNAGYGGTQVLFDITMSVAPGRICALMGRNGSGKTTLLRCINRVIRPDSGTINIMGKDIRGLNRHDISRMISVVPQTSFSPFSFSCLDMVLMAGASRLAPWQSPDRTDRDRALDVMEEAGVDHLAGKMFNAISGGERQLVMLARSLFQDTPMMLLDEPNSHLDFTNQHRMMEMMQRLVKKRQMSAVISLHDPHLTRYYCDDVVMIKSGAITAMGNTSDIMVREVLTEVLGSRIRCDETKNGVFVVTPESLNNTFKRKVM